MYIAMNRFKIAKGSESQFEDIWRNRDSKLKENPGFVEFHLLRGKTHEEEGFTQFVSHSTWESEEAFIGWTKSENFRAAHKNAGDNRGIYLGPPVFEGYTSVVDG